MIWNIINLGQTQCEINSCRSGSQTLFFGGREATTGNASAVRRLVGLTHSDKLYVFQTALVRADQSKTTLWESRDMKMIKVFSIPTFEHQQKKTPTRQVAVLHRSPSFWNIRELKIETFSGRRQHQPDVTSSFVGYCACSCSLPCRRDPVCLLYTSDAADE